MANQSGSLTSSSGIATITASPNDTLTVTPTSGSFTLEYPLGTVLASGISATTTYSLTAGGQARLMCITGSVAYSLTDNPDAYVLTQAQAATTQSLVAGVGTLWAARPSAAANPGMLLQVSDIGGAGGMLLRSDGSNWYPLGGSAVLLNRDRKSVV